MVLVWRLFTNGGQPVAFSQQAVNSVSPYVIAIVALTAFTCIYTAMGGIKAVIWTDVIQACLMFGGALIAIGTLLHHVGGFDAVARSVPNMTHIQGYFLTGLEPDAVAAWQAKEHVQAMTFGQYVRLVFASDYTLFSALIASTLTNMAAFGTDQDMVQRMLTATTYKSARRSLLTAAFMDIPIAAAFTFIGILLYVYYQQDPTYKPAANSDVFGAYILNVMPTGIRGLVLVGVFATAMGSLSAALNALATSATNDWYIPRIAARLPHADEAQVVRAARGFTLLFAGLMVLIAVAFAKAKVTDPNIRIIPVVLGIAGFILGPMLGVFLIGMFTRNRGSDRGNILAVTLGLMATIILGRLHLTLANTFFPSSSPQPRFTAPDWLPQVSFTWFAMIGALVVFSVGVLFRTPAYVLEAAKRKAEEAIEGGDQPLVLRDVKSS